MKTPIKVTVTKAHLKAAIPRTIGFCPVALALKDAGVKDATVNRWGRHWHVGIRGRAFELPAEAKKIAVAFDYKKPIELPVTFGFPRTLIPNVNALTGAQVKALGKA